MLGNTDDLPAAGAETSLSDADDDDDTDLVLSKSTLTRKRTVSFSDSDDKGVTAKQTKSFSCPLANNDEEQSSSNAAGGLQRPCWPIGFIVREEHLDVTVKRLLMLCEECVRYEGVLTQSENVHADDQCITGQISIPTRSSWSICNHNMENKSE